MAEQSNNQIAAHIRLSSSTLSPSDISRITGLTPSWQAKKGDPDPCGRMRARLRAESVWILSTERVDEVLQEREMGSLVAIALDMMDPCLDRLLPHIMAGAIVVQVTCEVWIRAKYMPCFDFSSELVCRIARLHARWTWDFYWWPRDL